MGYEKRQFLYGMDFDTEERLVEQGFTRKNVNVRIGSSTDDGVLSAENVQGNKLIPNLELPAGDNKVIGSYWYKLKDINYFFVWNSEGNHGIYEYDHVPAKITTVMIAGVFNFQEKELITGINVVEFDDDNDLLYWSDGFNPPRKINIQKAKADGYVTPLNEEVIDAIKYPPLCPPTAEYAQDEDQEVNYFKDQVWQFKAAYVYDDKEVSAFSPISIQVLPGSCGSKSVGNTIKITIPKGGELVERVIVAGRKGNLTDFLELIDQEVDKYELDSEGNYVYTFRNNGTYNVVDLQQSIKLFDWVPQKAQAQEFVQNRITYGNITEGYDNVDVDLKLNVSYREDVSTPSNNKISGFLRIAQNLRPSNSIFGNFQPIHKYNGEYVFGGFGEDRGSIIDPDAFTEGTAADYYQSIPLGGFVIYLAGTDYYTISKQFLANPGDERRIQDENNIFNSDNRENRNIIRDAMSGDSGGPDKYGTSRVWSTWEFENIPDGTYIMRVASHLTTLEDLAAPGRPYQKTSTTLNRIGLGFYDDNKQTFEKEIVINVSGGEILENIDIVVSDCTNPGFNKDSAGVAGYLVDPDDISYTPTDFEEALGKKRIELNTMTTLDGIVGTDHNGFFFDNVAFASQAVKKSRSGLFSQDIPLRGFKFNPADISAGTPVEVAVENTGNTLDYFVVSNSSADITRYSRANAEVVITDSDGNGVKGVTVVLSNGDIQETNSEGVASFIGYAAGGLRFRDFTFLYYLNSECSVSSFEPTFLSKDAFIGERYFNDVAGSDVITFDPVVISTDELASVPSLKNGGSYGFGIVYYDRANRSGAVNFSQELFLPFYTEASPIIKTAPIIDWEIKNNPPEWATHYQIVRTKNTAVNEYIQWFTNEISYLDEAGDPSNFNDGTSMTLDITNLTDEYKKANPDSVLAYDFTTGDRIRFIKNSNDVYFEEYFDVKVLGFSAGVLTVENPTQSVDLSKGLTFEIYTPKLDVDQDLYYEIGECYEIGEATAPLGGTVKFHKGGTFDQNPFTGSPATGTLKGGDTYYRSRNIRTSTGVLITKVDSQLVSDFWDSKISDIGRPNIIDKDAQQVTRPVTIYYSERFIPETNINGLNSFFDINFEQYDRNFGSIQKLHSYDRKLDCYQELKTGWILVGENILRSSQGAGTVTYSDDVLSDIQYYSGNYGTLNPESFTENEGRRYFFDIRNGKVLRLSTDGLTPISDNKMHSYFEAKSNFYSAFGIIPEIWGTYDKNHDEYVIGFGSVSRDEGFTPDDLALVGSQAETVTEERDGLTYTFIIGYEENEEGVDPDFEIVRDVSNGTYVINSTTGDLTLDRQKILSIPAETLGFSERTKHWTSFYTYTPECMSRVGIDFLTFRKGRAFLHNQSGKRNNFYGGQSSSEVWVIFNQDPSNNKVYQALSEESDTVWEAREILTLKGQKSNLIVDDFEVDYGQDFVTYDKENIHYASLWQDENTPNVDLPLINGDSMRDTSILFKLINDSEDEERLYAASVRYSLSPRTNR